MNPEDERGVSLVEVLVAMSILAVVAAAVAACLGSALRLTRDSRHRVVAANLAAEAVESARSTSFAELQPGAAGQPGVRREVVDVGNDTFTVESALSWLDSGSSSVECADAHAGTRNQLSFLRLDVAVTWEGTGGTHPVTSQTVVAPPPGSSTRTAATWP